MVVSSNAHRSVVAVAGRGLWCHMIEASESIKIVALSRIAANTENSKWTRKLNFLFYHKCNTSGRWTCVLGSKKNMVFVVMTSRKTTRACVIVFTVRYNSVPQNGSFISILLFFCLSSLRNHSSWCFFIFVGTNTIKNVWLFETLLTLTLPRK